MPDCDSLTKLPALAIFRSSDTANLDIVLARLLATAIDEGAFLDGFWQPLRQGHLVVFTVSTLQPRPVGEAPL